MSDPAYGDGKISAGFYAVADGLWKRGLGAAVERELARGCRSITVSGHSLGGAVAQLLAVRIEVRSSPGQSTRAAVASVHIGGAPVWLQPAALPTDLPLSQAETWLGPGLWLPFLVPGLRLL